MLKRLVNEAHCTLRITTTGPLLVKSGGATISGPDMTPILTYRNGEQQIFIPGSSLKGAFRSHLEKIAGGLQHRVACYPFEEKKEQNKEVDPLQRHKDFRSPCSQEITKLIKENDDPKNSSSKIDNLTEVIYANSCPICRLFGSTGFIGRIAIGDAYLASSSATELRDGVGIDRFTGGASHGAKFQLEVVSTGVTFEANIHLRNFEIWQLGMLFVVLQDLKDELIPLGSGRSRGLGNVTACFSTEQQPHRPGGFITYTMRNNADRKETDNELWGLGRWLGDGSYGTWKDDRLTLKQPIARQPNGVRMQRIFAGEALQSLQTACIEDFVTRIQSWPPELDFAHLGEKRTAVSK
jgi:CRISPR-associated RAMP protein, SSO1426 family